MRPERRTDAMAEIALDMSRLDKITSDYVRWAVEERKFTPYRLRPESVDAFVSPPEESVTLSVMERLYLYISKKHNIMLPGPTGIGKTTAIENIAATLKLPFYRQDAHTKLRSSNAMLNSQMVKDETITLPGPLLQAMMFDGLYFLEEAANLSGDGIVEFHSALQQKMVEVQTHMGPIRIEPKDLENFVMVGAGNFRYQHTHWNPASWQRWTVVRIPDMDSDQHTDVLHRYAKGEHTRQTVDMDSIAERFRQLYEETPVTEDALRNLSEMFTEIRDGCRTRMGKDFDLNMNCAKRAIDCYSPGLSQADYSRIIHECMVLPMTQHLSVRGDEKTAGDLQQIVDQKLGKNKNLFSQVNRSAASSLVRFMPGQSRG